ncbi:MAG TPA: aldo/keto reductase [Armatimonadota bacterium]|nr:aldo/keto reductase [Armatimonadota bacterium]
MKNIPIGTSGLEGSEISLGCMRIGGKEARAVDTLIGTALDAGINFFDHADIYGGGKCEQVFAESVARLRLDRSKLILQSKCGIRSGFFDFSNEHIVSSVDGILKRLQTDYLDVLLLHRPDALVEPEEVAGAFTKLQESGKVRHFGVSNQNPGQIELLQASLPMKIQINQLQFSVTNTGMIDRGLNVNMQIDRSVDRDGGILDYCRLKKITIQTWSPFQHGFFRGAFLNNAEFPELNKVIDAMAETHGVSNTAIAIAWILRHPARMQPIVGTTSPERIKQVAQASEVALTRPQWYEIYRAAGNTLP